MIRNESDTAWKEILDAYFKDFVEYCLPELNQLINWSRPWLSLDKELQAITKGTQLGKRLLDKLFKVFLNDGCEQWILVHIEIQGQRDEDFPKRMFTYGYRIYDKYQQPIVSCAILSDDCQSWRPNHYKIGLAGSFLSTEFLVIKILDYRNKLIELETSTNPFASVILVQLSALDASRKAEKERKEIKFSLTRRLYDKGYTKDEVIKLYRFIDWLIGLSEPVELEYLEKVHELEEAKKMAYISSAERLSMKLGMQKGIEKAKLEMAEQLLSEGAELAYIVKITKLSLDKLKELQDK